eukprot:1348736-Amorphochlora_amoeboformis.AAC.1
MAMAVLMAVIMTTALGFGPIVNSTSLSGVATAVRRAPTGNRTHGQFTCSHASLTLMFICPHPVTVPAGDVNKCIKRSIKAIE